ncbi:hypothetical protein SAMN05216456_1300 [Devosia crocina]|uniref:Uncharacterized protein n=2 Tax=Devosia crocina TaxID=429728 RepID=A0A1I7N9K6_9HYPH|nr:hypothetical protein SAMN05216456_1300 [Devosia crocina]
MERENTDYWETAVDLPEGYARDDVGPAGGARSQSDPAEAASFGLYAGDGYVDQDYVVDDGAPLQTENGAQLVTEDGEPMITEEPDVISATATLSGEGNMRADLQVVRLAEVRRTAEELRAALDAVSPEVRAMVADMLRTPSNGEVPDFLVAGQAKADLDASLGLLESADENTPRAEILNAAKHVDRARVTFSRWLGGILLAVGLLAQPAYNGFMEKTFANAADMVWAHGVGQRFEEALHELKPILKQKD